MPPKRPVVEVIELSDSDSDDHVRAPPPPPQRSGQPSRAGSGTAPPHPDQPEEAEEDAALALAIKLSIEEAQRAAGAGTSNEAARTPSGSGQTLSGGLGDRAELERQRLDRQRARGDAAPTVRVASTSAAAVGKKARVTTFADLLAKDDDGHPSAGSSGSAVASTSRSTSSSTSKHLHRFWQGVVKRVTNSYVPDSESYSFADLIGPASTLQMAVVSAYVTDVPWVVSHFEAETPLLLIQARLKGDDQPALTECSLKPNTYRVIPKERTNGPFSGVMHVKLMIYYHDDFCRVVIPTANAVPYDWAAIDNAFFVIDFPWSPSDDKDPFKNPTHTQFSRSFFQVCFTLGAPKLFVKPAANYDFSSSKDVQLVHSTQGRYNLRDEERKGGGLASLAKAVLSFDFAPGGRWEIEATGSSIGRYTPAWLSQMLGACSGIAPSQYFRSGKNNDVPREYPKPPPGQPVRLPIKIVFPTEDEITGSFGGAAGGGTLFCPVKTWDASGFPQHLFHRGVSKRARVAAHTKIILALQKFPGTQPAQQHSGWMYIGSHNFTSAAWGRPENGSNGPTLAISNYELGVVLPIRANSADELEQKATDLVTYRRPLSRYGPADRPWQQERFLSPG